MEPHPHDFEADDERMERIEAICLKFDLAYYAFMNMVLESTHDEQQ